MNRRTFLGFLATAPVVAPAAARGLLTQPWKVVEIIEKRFDFNTALGVCYRIRNSLTGEELRHAVRVFRPTDWSAQSRRARQILDVWVRDVNAGRWPAPKRYFHPDRLLEGHEMRL